MQVIVHVRVENCIRIFLRSDFANNQVMPIGSIALSTPHDDLRSI